MNSKLCFKVLRRGRGSIQNTSLLGCGGRLFGYLKCICKFYNLYIFECLCTTCTSFSTKPNNQKCNDQTKMIFIILINKSIFWFLSMDVPKTRFRTLFWYIESCFSGGGDIDSIHFESWKVNDLTKIWIKVLTWPFLVYQYSFHKIQFFLNA